MDGADEGGGGEVTTTNLHSLSLHLILPANSLAYYPQSFSDEEMAVAVGFIGPVM